MTALQMFGDYLQVAQPS